MSSTSVESDRDVLIEHVLNASRRQVYDAWTDPTRLVRWFAPHGCRIEFKQIDVRPGGEFHSCIHTPDGYRCWCRGTYREIVAPQRVVFTMAIADAAGNLLGPKEAGMDPAWPRETVVTVTFAELNGETRLTLHQTVAESLAKKTGAHASWLQMLDRLAGCLA